MQPQTDSDYKKIFTELIKRQMVVLGPDITLAKVKNVQGVEVNEQGEVTNIQGDPQALLQLLINQFVELSGAIVKKTMESILNTYPGMAGMAVNAVVSQPTVQAPPVPSAPTKNEPPVSMGANPFSDIQPHQVSQDPTPQQSGMGQDDIDTINKALSELSSTAVANSPQPLENKNNSMQELNNN